MAYFTQKHYEFLARFLRREIEVSTEAVSKGVSNSRLEVLHGITRLLASELEHDNKKFDRAYFLRAAGSHE